MRRVADHLHLASFVRISNVWLLRGADGKQFLVDTGYPLERPMLLLSLWRAGVRRPGDLAGVLLTHRHSDHAGNAAWLRRRFACPVVCHEDDAPALSGKCPPARLSRRRAPLHDEILCRIEDRLPARCEVDEVYREGAWRHGFAVVHVPGHTEGSVMLYHEPTETLFSGDAILAGPPPLRCIEWLRLAVKSYSLDVALCHARVKSYLGALPPIQTLCSGHGPPVARAHEKLLRLLDQSAS
jgi:glyoxylase-like metal-dependent hydrolase (beta-lactamase superfamily II)